MQRTKKPIIWLMMVALVVSLIPAGLAPVASAAGQTSYFTPDNTTLKSTVGLLLDGKDTDTNKLTRERAYRVTNKEEAVSGTFVNVSGSTLAVNVQQLNQDGGKWVESTTRVAPGFITADPESPDNRFNATLTLFPGMNKVTFTGSQGPSERSETFYILFDQVPYLQDVQIMGGSSNLNLNDGSKVVVNAKAVTIQGTAMNASKVTVSMNNGEALPTSLLEDGSFFTPQMQLNPGENKIKLIAQNGQDTLTFNYSLLYYDIDNPVVGLDLVGQDSTQNLLGTRPSYTGDKDQALVKVKVLIPDQGGQSFIENANVTVRPVIEGATTTPPAVTVPMPTQADKQIFIPSTATNTPSYYLVEFEIDKLQLAEVSNEAIENQEHTITIQYGTQTINKTFRFLYQPGQVAITGLQYLKGYSEGGTIPAGQPLNGATIDNDEFYIAVETSTAVADQGENGANKIIAKYLPLGTSAIDIKYIMDVPVPVGSTQNPKYIYKITGFKNGTQTVRFNYNIGGNESKAYRDATISFASKNYIYIENVNDGETYDVNSKEPKPFKVSGQLVGFGEMLKSDFFVFDVFANGTKYYNYADSTASKDLTFNKETGTFSFELSIDGEKGPLFFGENRLVLTATGKDGENQTSEIKKEVRFYINDNNVSTVKNFQPTLVRGRQDLPTTYNSDDAIIKNLFNLAPEFTLKDNVYTTSQKTFDIAIRGAGAERINLNMGTKNIFTLKIPQNQDNQTAVTWDTPEFSTEFKKDPPYVVDRIGSQDEFVVRLRDLPLETPGTYIYTLELINKTGAKTSQKLEIVRESTGYRLLSPQPTSGDKIVVNKNFVHIDIEAEGATQVLIGKEPAVRRTDVGEDRFMFDYVGLKQDKSTAIKITVERPGSNLTDTINVFYTGTVGVDAQYMAPKVATKYTVFNKQLQLNFPKGTVMQSTDTKGIAKYYPDTKLLFGIADPVRGVVERRNDYGNVIGFINTGEESGLPTWQIQDEYYTRFGSTAASTNFSPISEVYWINGGMGETGDRGTQGYRMPTNGLPPYSSEALFGDPNIPSERKITPSQRGTLTLTYDSNVVDDAGSTITVFRYNSKREWQNIGGEVNTKAHTITVPFDEFGYYKVMKLKRSYNDIINHNWARNVLNGLYSKGFMNNLRFEQFGTDDRTTRGEFATLLVKGLNLPINSDSNNTFTDLRPGTSSTTWDYDSIETAARAGILSGLSNGVVGADRPLTREQAAVMIARALQLKLSANDAKLEAAVAKGFVDSGSIEKYALPAVQAVSKAKIMEGAAITIPGQKKPQYNFNPKGNLTRAEAGKIAVELLKKSTKIFPKNLS
ncbi:S-layer homology domain-containing protein [Paenibacillus amylolyticus]|uniref:S-layer homology domain-containing protein n=1 Tax=Paenibacillus amylolyticus TaxID=1451 RepID=UPI003242102E